MKNKLSDTWKNISENGISDDLDNAEKKRIRILNRIIFLNAILAFIFVIIDLANSSFEAAIISSITFAISPLLFLLIKNKFYYVAKWIIVLFVVVFISAVSIVTGKDSDMILYFIPGILFPTIIFQRKKSILVLSAIILGVLIAVFVINQIYNPQIITSQKELTYYSLSSLIGCTIITLLIVRYLKSTNSEYEKIIFEKNKSLNIYNIEINEQKIKLEAKNIENEQLVLNLESTVQERTLTLQKTKDELAEINLSLQKKVFENTKKNMDLSRSIMEQEKLVTIGEISAGIAHDLNTPLGTIRVGADNINFILNSLFNGTICDFTKDELSHILNHVEKNRIEMYVGGLQMRKEKAEMLEYLNASLSGKIPDALDDICDLLVKCRFDPSKEQEISMILSKPFAKEYLLIMNQLQMAMAQLETIRKSSDKAVGVVRDMRAFIKGESVVEQKTINLRDNISTVLGVFNYEISLHVNLVFEVDPSIEFMGYDIKLFQLWSNIVKNGLEAMSDQKDRYLGIFAERKEGQLKVVFENNGPKIPEEIAETIFQKFYTTKSKKSGSGLGLSIVKNVLKEHKADIIVESSETLTKFIITFDI